VDLLYTLMNELIRKSRHPNALVKRTLQEFLGSSTDAIVDEILSTYAIEERPAPIKRTWTENNSTENKRPSTTQPAARQKCPEGKACTKQDCEQYHPTIQCKNFPNCPFGDDCFFLHEDTPAMCRFGAHCTKGDECLFKH